MNDPVVVVRTGTANLASVVAAMGRAGMEVEVTSEPTRVDDAARLVLPGVGSFGPVMGRINELGLGEPLARRINEGRPTLAICLGLQLLAGGSAEEPGMPGLEIFDAEATRFPGRVRVPQLGWNRIQARPGCEMLTDGAGYFANSYRLESVPDGWHGAISDHGGEFVAAIERGPVLACQFHPELSGSWGHGLIERWLAKGEIPC
jgi:imidazole glycerol phosphate synthase glutamine amidotransferase subunit